MQLETLGPPRSQVHDAILRSTVQLGQFLRKEVDRLVVELQGNLDNVLAMLKTA